MSCQAVSLISIGLYMHSSIGRHLDRGIRLDLIHSGVYLYWSQADTGLTDKGLGAARSSVLIS